MKKRIAFILILGIISILLVNFSFSQQNAKYIKRVINYIKNEGKEFELNANFEDQDAFDMLLKDVGDNMIFMFGDYYPTNEINMLATKTFIMLHKNKGFKNMLIDIDAKYQKDYENWLNDGKRDYYFTPYFTGRAEKLLLDYYKSLPKDKKFKVICMRNAAQDEGDTFTSREKYLRAGGSENGYRRVVKDNKYKTFVRKLLKKNPYEKYFIYTRFTNTTKYSDMKYFKSEYERLGTYLNERNEISKGKVFSTTCAIRTGSTMVGERRVSVVIDNTFNNIPYLIEQEKGSKTKSLALPLTRGWGNGSIFEKVKRGWQLDSLAQGSGTSMVEVVYNKINKRWDYIFYFYEVSSWKR